MKKINKQVQEVNCKQEGQDGPVSLVCTSIMITRQVLSQLTFGFKRSLIEIFKMVAILDLKSEWFFDLHVQVTLIVPMQWRIESVSLLAQDKKYKTGFQHGSYGDHLRFTIGTTLVIFLFTSHPDTSYKVLIQLAFQFRRRSWNWWPFWISKRKLFVCVEVLRPSQPNGGHVERGQFT